MSDLENAAKEILEPFIFNYRGTLRLSADNLETLATWATKTWMAYALTRPAQGNPLLEADYRAMAAHPRPVNRSRIWLMHAHESHAQVGLGIASTLLSSTDFNPDLEATPDNCAFAYLAASTVVLFMLVVPDVLPRPVAETLVPPTFSLPGVRQIWSNPRRQYFPLDRVPDAAFAQLMYWPREVFDAFGLPVYGLNDDDVSAIRQEFLDGGNPEDIRKRWES
jgi:hypothetical protein